MATIENDNDCLELLRKNDTAAWQYLIRVYYPVLCRFAKRILLDNDTAAEDAIMEIFVKLWRQNADFTCMQQLKQYLYTSTRNHCLNIVRSKQREKIRHEVFAETYLHADDPDEHEIIYAELLAEIRKEMVSLSPRMREVFYLAYFKKMSNEEIAGHLQLSNQTVRNQKTTALSIIRKALKPKWETYLPGLLICLGKFY
ncbi:hypothetical protein DC498_14455 [Terrimonas sp.]|uniref:RNA polymerase sigma factor n=1 Tax=Terrimonas sp. TaxID=1914338 RepID=UPI000D519440|nr:sigma-70 family RNA polymerase sigma factor [Terrimonas sp.]PVD51618.1 hypothetical protein DC498_14455 [Terrimonas sp.]